MNAQYIICDESQNFTFKELTTAITRLGKFSKIIILADPNQSDINGRSGFMPMFDLFNSEESKNQGIHCFSFTKDDIVRSGILRYISEKIENHNINHKTEPMFSK
jgi:phosphate starvation-inducible protein PhoH